MDRNELVEKAVRAMYEYSPYATWAYEDWDAVDPKDEWRDMATAALDAILPDVIEAVHAEAARIADSVGHHWSGTGSTAAFEVAESIRAAVLGDALKGGK